MNLGLFLNSRSNPVSQVEEYLYLGNRDGARNVSLLKEHGIRAVVQIQSAEVAPFFPACFDYHRITLPDLPTSNLLRYLPDTLRFIHDAIQLQKKVFVHCDAGISRSTSVVIAYYMAVRQWPYRQALDFVRARRSCTFPNDGFQRQLESLDTGTMSAWLR